MTCVVTVYLFHDLASFCVLKDYKVGDSEMRSLCLLKHRGQSEGQILWNRR